MGQLPAAPLVPLFPEVPGIAPVPDPAPLVPPPPLPALKTRPPPVPPAPLEPLLSELEHATEVQSTPRSPKPSTDRHMVLCGRGSEHTRCQIMATPHP